MNCLSISLLIYVQNQYARSILLMPVIPTLANRFNRISIAFVDTDKAIPKFLCKGKIPRIANTIQY